MDIWVGPPGSNLVDIVTTHIETTLLLASSFSISCFLPDFHVLLSL